MRFIGSKALLLGNIEEVIAQNTDGTEHIFCDIFSGTAAVAQHFKPHYEMYSNDSLYFSYVIQKATIENNELPAFKRLSSVGICEPLKFLEEAPINFSDYSDENNFIAKNYSPHDNCTRMYLSNSNATRIDFIRDTIEAWNASGWLSANEYYYLLAALIEGVPFVSNITGTYGAYLKQWDKRAYKEYEMVRLDVVNNHYSNHSYNEDANSIIKRLEGDILYLDPPYNNRQYAPNYHLLETITKNDHPKIKGITGMREYHNEKSPYCVKGEVLEAFEDLIQNAKFSNIVLSYSSDGLMTARQIEAVLKKHGIEASFKRYDIPYRKYKSKVPTVGAPLCEYIFFVKKNIVRPYIGILPNDKSKGRSIASASTMKYVKSPLNYIGGKYKLLPQILPIFPSRISTFVDLFSGGTNVAINVNADKIICNDINSKIIEMFLAFESIPLDRILSQIESNIATFNLTKENEEGFVRFRNYYNQTKDPIDLYTLTCYSFNYQFRFNNQHEYNNPFGRDRSHFSGRMRANLIAFVEKLRRSNIEFVNHDFIEFNLETLGSHDMIYCDPPYLITTGTYNDGNRGFKDWGINEDRQLRSFLDRANDKNIKFALSNVLEHKDKVNQELIEWSAKYKVADLKCTYANSSYNTVRGKSREVIITNY